MSSRSVLLQINKGSFGVIVAAAGTGAQQLVNI